MQPGSSRSNGSPEYEFSVPHILQTNAATVLLCATVGLQGIHILDGDNGPVRLSAVKLVCIYGLPATGKLTVARELAAITGFRLFHNHLAVDLLLSIFEFGSPPFIELREDIWLSVFDRASRCVNVRVDFHLHSRTHRTPRFHRSNVKNGRGCGRRSSFRRTAMSRRRVEAPYGKSVAASISEAEFRFPI